MPQGIVRIIFKSHPCSWVPLGMLLAKALLGIGSKSQLLALSQLDNQDVCRQREVESGKGRRGSALHLTVLWKTTHLEKQV